MCSNYWLSTCRHVPRQEPLKKKGMPNLDSMDIMFGGMVATRKNAFCTSGQIPKESTEGSGNSTDSKEFVDPHCQPSVNVNPMEVEGPSSSRVGPIVNKGKGLASSVHLSGQFTRNQEKSVQLCKRCTTL